MERVCRRARKTASKENSCCTSRSKTVEVELETEKSSEGETSCEDVSSRQRTGHISPVKDVKKQQNRNWQPNPEAEPQNIPHVCLSRCEDERTIVKVIFKRAEAENESVDVEPKKV